MAIKKPLVNYNGDTKELDNADDIYSANGLQAQPNLTTGSWNIGFGNLAVNDVTSGSFNLGFGEQAVRRVTSGSANIGFGALALNKVTTGSDNITFGYAGLSNTTTGVRNIAIGSGLMANTTGSENIAIGGGLNLNSVTANGNIAIGVGALTFNAVSNNVALGHQSAYSNVIGSNITAIGYQALNNNGKNVSAESFVVGTFYKIKTVGTTNFTLIGATDNNVGTVFQASGVGSGTGNADINGADDNTAVGYQALLNNTSGGQNTAVGNVTLLNNTTGTRNVAVGSLALQNNTSGFDNVGIGVSVLQANTTGRNNIAVGIDALNNNTIAMSNTAVGRRAGWKNVVAENSVFIGTATGQEHGISVTAGSFIVGEVYEITSVGTTNFTLIGSANNTVGTTFTATGVGSGTGTAAYPETDYWGSTFVGMGAAYVSRTGSPNVAVGSGAFYDNELGKHNTAIGTIALSNSVFSNRNTAVGHSALLNFAPSTTAGSFVVGSQYRIRSVGTTDFTLIGSANNFVGTTFTATGVGSGTGTAALSTGANTALGREALVTNTVFINCTGLGANTAVTGSNQVQLGDASTTTYAYGAIQNRSDIRDKTDIRPCQLGLEFINKIDFVDFKWDKRDEYRTPAPVKPEYPQRVDSAQLADETNEDYQTRIDAEYDAIKAEIDAEFEPVLNAWLESVKLENITHDGTHKGKRYHHGVIAQQLKSVLDELGTDFGGYQDHKLKGGDDVLSVGYEEFIAPMGVSIQQLAKDIALIKAHLGL